MRVSRDGGRVVYAIVRNDRPGRPYTQLWVQDVGATSGKALLPARGSRQFAAVVAGRQVDRIPRVHRRRSIADDRAPRRHRVDEAGAGAEHAIIRCRLPATRSRGRRTATRLPSFVRDAGPRTGSERRPNGHHAISLRSRRRARASRGSTTTAACTSSSSTSRPGPSGSSPTARYYEHSVSWSPLGKLVAFISNRGENRTDSSTTTSSPSIRRRERCSSSRTRRTPAMPAGVVARRPFYRLSRHQASLTSSERRWKTPTYWVMNADRERTARCRQRSMRARASPVGRTTAVSSTSRRRSAGTPLSIVWRLASRRARTRGARRRSARIDPQLEHVSRRRQVRGIDADRRNGALHQTRRSR